MHHCTTEYRDIQSARLNGRNEIIILERHLAVDSCGCHQDNAFLMAGLRMSYNARYCSAINCSNNTNNGDKSFHRFPVNDPER